MNKLAMIDLISLSEKCSRNYISEQKVVHKRSLTTKTDFSMVVWESAI